MRRGLVTAALCLGLVLTLAAMAAVAIGAGYLPAPWRNDPSVPEKRLAVGELTPEERTVLATPQRDGTVRVSLRTVFDVVPGFDGPVSWYIGGTGLGWESDRREAQYGVIPDISAVKATVVQRTGKPGKALAVTVDDHLLKDPFYDGHLYRFVPSAPWSVGRHAVEISYTLSKVWIEADRQQVLVIPLAVPTGPGNEQPLDLTRIQVTGATRLQCPATNVSFSDRTPCGTDGTYVTHESTGVSQVQALVVVNPPGIDAVPIPVTRRTV